MVVGSDRGNLPYGPDSVNARVPQRYQSGFPSWWKANYFETLAQTAYGVIV
jgi:hypothetical protein